MTFPTLYDGTVSAINPLIYGLVDPRAPSVVRYVGSTYQPMARYVAHCTTLRYRPGGKRRIAWMAGMAQDGYRPTMLLIERLPAVAGLRERERHWIDRLRLEGQADLNGVDAATAFNTGQAVSRAWHKRRSQTA